MATHPDYESDSIYPLSEPTCRRKQRSQEQKSLESQVEALTAEMSMLQKCLNDSLELQQKVLRRLVPRGVDATVGQRAKLTPVASSTPHIPSDRVPYQGMNTVDACTTKVTFSPQVNSSDVTNTSRILASVLYQSKLEPPVFTGDGRVHPEDWLQSVNGYKTSLELNDAQILFNLPRFLGKEPKKWFSILSSHITSWARFCELFKTVFLPSDDQEQIRRGILDHFQTPEEPFPTFVAHMLSEFKKLKTPPPKCEQIDLICKHSLEKYRISLYGTSVPSGMDLRAHELHVVLGSSACIPAIVRNKTKMNKEIHCFKCLLPGFTSRTCPKCNSFSETDPHHVEPIDAQMTPTLAGSLNLPEHRATYDGQSSDRRSGNFRGGRMIRRGSPPSKK